MRRTMWKGWMVLGLMAVSAGAVRADCAQFVTSGAGDQPMNGYLIGTKTVSGSIGGRGVGLLATYTESYEVGLYRMSDGSTAVLSCFDYSVHKL